jgi:hypothetical protein
MLHIRFGARRRRELILFENHKSQNMRECSEISDVIDYWRHFIVTTMATLACRSAMPNVDVGMAHISKQ